MATITIATVMVGVASHFGVLELCAAVVGHSRDSEGHHAVFPDGHVARSYRVYHLQREQGNNHWGDLNGQHFILTFWIMRHNISRELY